MRIDFKSMKESRIIGEIIKFKNECGRSGILCYRVGKALHKAAILDQFRDKYDEATIERMWNSDVKERNYWAMLAKAALEAVKEEIFYD